MARSNSSGFDNPSVEIITGVGVAASNIVHIIIKVPSQTQASVPLH